MQSADQRRSLVPLIGGLAVAGLAIAGLAFAGTSDDAVAETAVQPTVETHARLFFLNIRGQVLSAEPDGSDVRVLVDDLDSSPDGIYADVPNGHIYWSNMGRAKDVDGSIVRANLDGSGVTAIVPSGSLMTGKQMTMDTRNGKIYWSDREGMRVMRANLDGSSVETVVEIASGDDARLNAANWAVGIAVDPERGQVYWSQKGGDNEGVGSIRRAGMDLPAGESAANRSDIEVLFAGLPEPIDLDLDLASRTIYWTDRGDAPAGNNVTRAPMDPPAGFDPMKRSDAEVLIGDLDEGIGISLDLPGNRMFVTDLRGNLYTAALDGTGRKVIGTGLGSLTGISFAEVPVTNAAEGAN